MQNEESVRQKRSVIIYANLFIAGKISTYRVSFPLAASNVLFGSLFK